MQELEAEERSLRRGFITHKKSDDPPAKFSDPRHMSWLPFPHTTSGQPSRFSLHRRDKVVSFAFMGRRIFRPLYELATEYDEDPFQSYAKVNLHGCTGTGKSHILAALAYLLTHEGKRVVYVPDCQLLVESFLVEMRAALQFAFPEYATTMDTWTNVPSILDFCRKWRSSGSLFFVMDQREALEFVPDDPDKERKADARMWLDELTSRNFLVFSADPNCKTYRPQPGKRTNVRVIALHIGFDEEEMNWWWKHNSKLLPAFRSDDKKYIEDITGCVPLLLRPLLRLKDRQFVDAKELFLASEELVTARTCVLSFLQQKQEIWATSTEKTFYKHMDACTRELFISSPDDDIYDHRYFYFIMMNGAWQGHCSCGIARETIDPKVADYKDFNKKRYPHTHLVEIPESTSDVTEF